MAELQHYEFANEAFYLAFESKDFAAMSNIWCNEGEPVCLHPGWPPLVGRVAVLESWKNILSNPNQGHVSFFDPVITPISESSAAVVCYEQAGDHVMIATNVFRYEDDRPRLIIHQAGICPKPSQEAVN